MMSNLFTSIVTTVFVTVISFSLSSHCLEEITTDMLQYITRVPCQGPDGNCSLDLFMKENNSSAFLKSWMLALYFDIDKHSSRDIVSEVLPSLNKVLIYHEIVFGRVRCGDGEKHPVIASFCDNMDPSIVYAYVEGKKTEFWWSVSDLMTHRSFVLGNLLTLQYKWRLDMYTEENYVDKMNEVWRRKEPKRKFMMTVHVASVSLEVNTTADTRKRGSKRFWKQSGCTPGTPNCDTISPADRVKAFEFLGHVIRNIPNVTVAVVTGVIDDGVQFWYYDSTRCPDVTTDDEKKCRIQKITMEETEGKTPDELLCMLERYSYGLKRYRNFINLTKKSTIFNDMEMNRRLFKFCTFVMLIQDESKVSSESYSFAVDLSVEMYYLKMLVMIMKREFARELMDSMGSSKPVDNASVILKYNYDSTVESSNDTFSSSVSPPFNIIFKPYVGLKDPSEVLRVARADSRVYFMNEYYDEENVEFNPYSETDELFLLWTNQKATSSNYFISLNATRFSEITRNSDSPGKAIVLFFQPWNSASVYSRDFILPAAANYLQSQFGLTEKLFAVNCFDYNEVCLEEKIIRYPLIKVFHGKESTIFSDTVSVRNMVREAVLLGENFFIPKSTEEIDRILNYSSSIMDQVIVGVDIEDKTTLQELKKTASQYQGREAFIITSKDFLPVELKTQISKGTIVSYSKRSKPSLVFHQKSVTLGDFVLNARQSRVMELSWDFFKQISSSDRPLLILFVHHMTSRLHCMLNALASEHSGKMFFTWINARKQHEYPIFRDFRSPELVLRDPIKSTFHRFPIRHQLSKECAKLDSVIEKWIQNVFAGNLPPDEMMQERTYPPSGPYINILDDVYPNPDSSQQYQSESVAKPEYPVNEEVGSTEESSVGASESQTNLADSPNVGQMSTADLTSKSHESPKSHEEL